MVGARLDVKKGSAMALLEVCVDNPVGLDAAVKGGADRIELCSALEVGGLTPSPGLLARARQAKRPIMAMVRPRSGDFRFSGADIDTMVSDIRVIRSTGLEGAVLGASNPDGTLDEFGLRRMVAAADGMELVLHRAIDLAPDPVQAVELAIDIGFHRILSSGGAPKAVDGLDRLKTMVETAKGRITIMPGSGVTEENANHILTTLGTDEIHASCSVPVEADDRCNALGFVPEGAKRTSATRVAALKASISA